MQDVLKNGLFAGDGPELVLGEAELKSTSQTHAKLDVRASRGRHAATALIKITGRLHRRLASVPGGCLYQRYTLQRRTGDITRALLPSVS